MSTVCAREGSVAGTGTCMESRGESGPVRGGRGGKDVHGACTGVHALRARAPTAAAAAAASSLQRWRASEVWPKRREADATMKLATSDEAAKSQKTSAAMRTTENASGESVRR